MSEEDKNPHIKGPRVLKLTDAVERYVNITGCRQHFYPVADDNDIGLITYVEKRADTDDDRRWQSHSHPDIEEYIFVIKGEGRVVFGEGDETFEEESYDLAAGDFVITPRGVPHTFYGEFDGLWWHGKHNVWGQTLGNKHPSRVYNRPSRPTKEEQDDLPEVGDTYYMDAVETFITYSPGPWHADRRERIRELKDFRKDLWPDAEES